MVEIVGDSVEATEFGCNGVNPQAQSATIADVTSGDMDGGDTVNEVTLETALNAHETAINAIIAVLDKFGFTATS